VDDLAMMPNSPERVIQIYLLAIGFHKDSNLVVAGITVSAFLREQAFSRRQPNWVISAIETNPPEYR
jgi:hypothetical protein